VIGHVRKKTNLAKIHILDPRRDFINENDRCAGNSRDWPETYGNFNILVVNYVPKKENLTNIGSIHLLTS
jgi:hypothetical protein